MVLDNRLRSVVDEIEDSELMIDVGSDHGKVVLTALEEHRAKRGIASDISEGSLKKAHDLSIKMNIPLDTRCGDGLGVLRDDDSVDTCVIAGMGGKEIVKILSSSPVKVPKLILVPHRDARLTRLYLVESGYKIDKDYMVMEGDFYYNIIVASVGKGSITPREEYLGKNTRDNATFVKYISYRTSVLEDILRKTSNAELQRELDILRKI